MIIDPLLVCANPLKALIRRTAKYIPITIPITFHKRGKRRENIVSTERPIMKMANMIWGN